MLDSQNCTLHHFEPPLSNGMTQNLVSLSLVQKKQSVKNDYQKRTKQPLEKNNLEPAHISHYK